MYAEAVKAKLVFYEDWAPTTWEQRAAESAFSYHDDGTGKTTTKACGEWAAERGRGYFASANY